MGYSETVTVKVDLPPEEFLRLVITQGARDGWRVTAQLPNHLQMVKRAKSSSIWAIGPILRHLMSEDRLVLVDYKPIEGGTSFSAFVDKDFQMAKKLKTLVKRP